MFLWDHGTKNKFWSPSLAHTHRSWERIFSGSLGYTAVCASFVFRTQMASFKWTANYCKFFFWKKIHKTHTTPHHWKDKSICTASVVCLTAQTKTYAKLLFQWAVQEYLSSTNSAKLKSKQFRQVTYHHITPRRTQEAMLQKPHQNGIKSVFIFIQF